MATITGTAGNDTLIGTAGDDTIYGLDGDDTLIGGTGANLLDGGSGFNIADYSGASKGVTVSLAISGYQNTGYSTDQLVNIQEIIGSPFNDTLTAGPGGSVLIGGAGIDTLIGGPGADLIIGGPSNDHLSGGGGADTFAYFPGDSTLSGGTDGISNFVTGVEKIDLTGLGSPNVTISAPLIGNGSIITADAAGAPQTVILTTGQVSGGDILVNGVNPSVTMNGISTSDTLIGGTNADILYGAGGADRLTGGAGADTFLYKSAADSTASASDLITDFTTGQDVIDLSSLFPSGVSIIRQGGASFVFASTAGGAMVVDVNGAVNGGDIAWGAGHTGVYLVGDNVGDTLTGGALGDSIHGGSGNDLIIGGAGADGFYGGAGADTFKYTAVTDSTASATDLILDFQTGTDKIDLAALAINHISTIDNGTAEFLFVETTSGSLMQIAAQGVDVIQAGDVNVTGGTNFYIQGDSGDNTLIGGVGKDVIDGHAGNDLIIGGGGSDALFGGAGSDTFKYLAASDSTVAAPDTIFDLQTGIDKIDLTGVHAAGVGSYGIAYTSTGSYLFVDVNGDGVNDMLIQFTTTALTVSDILWNKPSDTIASPASAAPPMQTDAVSAYQISSDFSADQGEFSHAWNTSIFQPHTLEPTSLLHM